MVDNFFTQRYDYRVEWLRCMGTLSQLGGGAALHIRVIRAIAQVVDSPAGLLFLRDQRDGPYRWAGSWNLPPAPSNIPLETELLGSFRNGDWVVELNQETAQFGGLADLWLAIPLSHAGRLTGFTLVSQPRAPFNLTREVFDLLRIVGQECASHVAEQQAGETLLQTRQLREYGERFAFVAHDIKNVASQLSLLLANAENHISNPDFQKDMLATVRASVNKIAGLLARLRDPLDPQVHPRLIPAERIKALIASRAMSERSRIAFGCGERCYPDRGEMFHQRVLDAAVDIAPEGFDAVIAHLLDNAFEASGPQATVEIKMRRDNQWVCIEIVDQGTGMSAEFIRDQLFQPFSSSKKDGFGLGVYQAREILRQAGGDLQVASQLGSGTTMTLSLPATDTPSGRQASGPTS